MKTENLSELSNEQLIAKFKSLKTDKIIDAFIIGVTVGIFIYSSINNGFSIFTFFPLMIGYLIAKNSATRKLFEQELLKEMKSRKPKPR